MFKADYSRFVGQTPSFMLSQELPPNFTSSKVQEGLGGSCSVEELRKAQYLFLMNYIGIQSFFMELKAILRSYALSWSTKSTERVLFHGVLSWSTKVIMCYQ